MPEHEIQVVAEYGELSLRLVCHAAKGAPCRMRPPEGDDRESWSADDEDLVDGDCWALDWIAADTFADQVRASDALNDATRIYATAPVAIGYDECVTVALATPQPTLVDDWQLGYTAALAAVRRRLEARHQGRWSLLALGEVLDLIRGLEESAHRTVSPTGHTDESEQPCGKQ